MGALSTWNLEGWRLGPVLDPGEQVLALTPTALPPGETVLPFGGPTKPTHEPRLLRALDGAWSVVTLPLRPFVLLTDAIMAAFTNDPPVHGDIGSAAQGIALAVDGKRDRLYLAVTDRRLLLLEGERLSQTEPFRLVAQLERGAVAAIEVRAKLLTGSVGRLRLTFADGSWLEFADGFAMGRKRASHVRDAVLHGRVAVAGVPRPPRG